MSQLLKIISAIVISLVAVIFFVSCQEGSGDDDLDTVVKKLTTSNSGVYYLKIASSKKACVGVAAQEYYWVQKEGNEKEWTLFYDNIEGFDFKEGYEYYIKVRVKNNCSKKKSKKRGCSNGDDDHDADDDCKYDASKFTYELIEVVSMTKKNSDTPAS